MFLGIQKDILEANQDVSMSKSLVGSSRTRRLLGFAIFLQARTDSVHPPTGFVAALKLACDQREILQVTHHMAGCSLNKNLISPLLTQGFPRVEVQIKVAIVFDQKQQAQWFFARRICPWSGAILPIKRLISVVFPDPLGPIIPIRSPLKIR